MSIKNKFKEYISAGDVSGTLTTQAIDIKNNYGCAVIASFSGAPSGAVIVQGSNDGVIWAQHSTDTISGTTTIGKNLDGLYYQYIRVTKAAGGTGTMTVSVSIKGA